MGRIHLSRREVLERIVEVGRGAVLLPLAALEAGEQPQQPRGVLRGRIADGADGRPTLAKVRVVDLARNSECWPEQAIRTKTRIKRPDQRHYFYARHEFEIALAPGRYRVEIVRGICHEPAVREVEIGAGRNVQLDVSLPVLKDVRRAGWYSGNTHTHYHVMKPEESPDERLALVPPAEALDISVISYLIRQDLAYATNRYPIGRLPQFSKAGTMVDMGEECRNNGPGEDSGAGYGHILFLNIPHLIEPVSTGYLSNVPKMPDFPTISMLAAKARKAGGTTVWCHNGAGMEMPVAAALGVMDAFNVADSNDASYEKYYELLDCGIRMPLSTGTDWWIYDHNRVFARVEGAFTYEKWLEAFRRGRTFATNGPLLEFDVDGQGPGAAIRNRKRVTVRAEAVSRVRFDRLEVVHDGGEVIAESAAADGYSARLITEVPVRHDGWIAARAISSHSTYGGLRPFAHTSPVYLAAGQPNPKRGSAASAIIGRIQSSMEMIRKKYQFASQADMAVALGQFEEGLRRYRKLV